MLAKLGDNGVEAFSELSRISKITGMEMNKLLAVTDKFDTFEGAAESVGKLNALLGGPFLNSMEMVMETDPTERMKKLSDGLRDSGKSFDQMSYYHLSTHLREVGALPEYSSREGCGVEVQDSRDEAGREFGRLVDV